MAMKRKAARKPGRCGARAAAARAKSPAEAPAVLVKGDKRADLAGPGVSTYEEVEKILPADYAPILDRKETQIAIRIAKDAVEDGLCRELNLIRVECPLI